VRAILQVLLLGVGVHGGHEPVLDTGEVVEHLRQRRKRVGRARRVRHDRVQRGIVGLGVDAEGEGDVRAGRWCTDEHPLGAGVEVRPCGIRGSEAAGGLEYEFDLELGPREIRGLSLGQHADAAPVDHEGVAVDLDGALEAAERGVVAQQVRERLRLREVVDGDDLEVGVALREGAEHAASDAAEAVDRDAGHG
jgi:hypothetical protein